MHPWLLHIVLENQWKDKSIFLYCRILRFVFVVVVVISFVGKFKESLFYQQFSIFGNGINEIKNMKYFALLSFSTNYLFGLEGKVLLQGKKSFRHSNDRTSSYCLDFRRKAWKRANSFLEEKVLLGVNDEFYTVFNNT